MIVGRGGGVVMLYVFFSLGCALHSCFLRGGGGISASRFFYLTSCANSRMNFLGGFFRSRAARTDVMFRNLLLKEVFTKTFLFGHDEECLPTVGSIYSLFLFVAGNCE